MTTGVRHDSSGEENKTTTAGEIIAGETAAHDNPVQEGCETAESMTNAMKMLFQQVDNPYPNGMRPYRRYVEENPQIPGQPFYPYVPLDEGFRAAGEKSFIFGEFIKSWDKIMAGEV